MAVKVNEVAPANPLMLEIAKLYLTKYETLEPDDRKLFRVVLKEFTAARQLSEAA
jgi:hypothetical protein